MDFVFCNLHRWLHNTFCTACCVVNYFHAHMHLRLKHALLDTPKLTGLYVWAHKLVVC